VLLQTTATTGLASFAAMLCVLLVFFNPFRKQGKTRHSLAKTWITLGAILGIVGLVLYFNPDLLDAARAVTIDKMEGESFSSRVLSDLFALTVFVNTGTLGAGLGSSRSSSLVTTLLSTVGIVGVTLLGAVLYKILKMFPGRLAPASLQVAFWAFLCILVADALAVPDLNRPAFWALGMLALVQLNLYSKRVVGNQASCDFTRPISSRIGRGALPAS